VTIPTPASPEVIEPAQEPETDSWRALVSWLDGPPRRSAASLAAVCNIGQQMISSMRLRRRRPGPEVARLMALATGGIVSELGWFTEEERAAQHERLLRAVDAAPRLALGQRVHLIDDAPASAA
jgi:hypothetical protein